MCVKGSMRQSCRRRQATTLPEQIGPDAAAAAEGPAAVDDANKCS